jgi:hypothetical protein
MAAVFRHRIAVWLINRNDIAGSGRETPELVFFQLNIIIAFWDGATDGHDTPPTCFPNASPEER